MHEIMIKICMVSSIICIACVTWLLITRRLWYKQGKAMEREKDWRAWCYCEECNVKWIIKTDPELMCNDIFYDVPADDRICPQCSKITTKVLVDWYNEFTEVKV